MHFFVAGQASVVFTDYRAAFYQRRKLTPSTSQMPLKAGCGLEVCLLHQPLWPDHRFGSGFRKSAENLLLLSPSLGVVLVLGSIHLNVALLRN